MRTITYTFGGMTVTVSEPMARHVLEAEVIRQEMLKIYIQRTGVSAHDMPLYEWQKLARFAEYFTGVVSVEDPAVFMPPAPLPTDADQLYDAAATFWEHAPLSFITKHNEVRNQLAEPADPNGQSDAGK